jgi:hypothetical protein
MLVFRLASGSCCAATQQTSLSFILLSFPIVCLLAKSTLLGHWLVYAYAANLALKDRSYIATTAARS